MTPRERFLRTMNYGPRDRAPLIDLGFWAETIEAWHQTGLPADIDNRSADSFFGTDGFWRYYLSPEQTDGGGLCDRGMIVPEGIRIGLMPFFEKRQLQDLGDQEILQIGDGTRIRRHKTMSSIPAHEAYLLTDRATWKRYYRDRLDPATPERYPRDWHLLDQLAGEAGRDHLLILPAGSLYGWIRNWMGVEGVSYLIYDDPAFFEEMIETITACILEVLARVLARGGIYDAAFYWEDMSYNGGPLISPRHFEHYLVPRYRRINELLHHHGITQIIVDSDGRLDELIPGWLDCGVNCVLPFEIGTTGADPLAYRRRFGRDLRMIGGFDKRILAASPEAIDREVQRLTPLVAEGGFVPACDHKIPPDVSLTNYRHYLEAARRHWTFA